MEYALEAFAAGMSFTSWLNNSETYSLKFHLLLSEILLRSGDPTGFPHQLSQLGLRMPHFPLPEIQAWHALNTQHRQLLITPIGGYGDQLLYAALIPSIVPYFERVKVAVHPDLLLSALFDMEPERILIAMRAHRGSLNNPPKTTEEYIETLRVNRLRELALRVHANADSI